MPQDALKHLGDALGECTILKGCEQSQVRYRRGIGALPALHPRLDGLLHPESVVWIDNGRGTEVAKKFPRVPFGDRRQYRSARRRILVGLSRNYSCTHAPRQAVHWQEEKISASNHSKRVCVREEAVAAASWRGVGYDVICVRHWSDKVNFDDPA